jgi:hypothetical protein
VFVEFPGSFETVETEDLVPLTPVGHLQFLVVGADAASQVDRVNLN